MSRHKKSITFTSRHAVFSLMFAAAIAGSMTAGVQIAHRSRKVVKRPLPVSDIETPTTPSIVPSALEVASAKRRVPILMYHYIRTVTDPRDRLGYNLSVTPHDFASQLAWLASHDYHTMSLDDFCRGRELTRGHSIVLTFDDGYADAYSQALPLLQQYHLSGTFFIISGFVNQPRYLSSAQLLSMADAGMELGAHTVHHIDLATANAARLKSEVEDSKQIAPVFAYPAGRYNQGVIQAVRSAGFDCAVTTYPGIATEKSPLFELPRVRVSGGESLETFTKTLQG